MAGRFHRQQTGFVLLVAIIAMAVLLVLGVAGLRIALNNQYLVSNRVALAQALTLAEAGADIGEAWLRTQSVPPVVTTYYPTNYASAPLQLKDANNVVIGTCYAKIVPDRNPYDPWSNYYTITGVGTDALRNRQRRVIMQISPRSFSMYGYMEDTGLSNNWWVSKLTTFDGPFHTNARLQISWDKNATTSDVIFRGTVSQVSTSQPKWYSSSATPTTNAQWATVFSGGKAALTTGADRVDFPTVASEQALAAWGNTTTQPTSQATADCYVRNPGGIYINSFNRTCNVTFSVNASGNQVLTVQHQVYQSNAWKDKYTEVTVNLPGNTTSVRTKVVTGSNPQWSTANVTAGVPNGVLYSTGSINALSGTLAKSYVSGGEIRRANNWTVAADYSTTNKRTITVSNDLKYVHRPDYVNYGAKSDYNLEVPALGVLGYQVIVNDSADYRSGVYDDIYLDGVYMGLNGSPSMYVTDTQTNKRLRGNLYIYGGTVVKTAAVLGTFTGTNTLTYGYHEHYSYDVRMADGPLVAFPNTNKYNVISWQYQ